MLVEGGSAMKVGDLVKTKRAVIGFPVGSLGLILKETPSRVRAGRYKVYDVAMVGGRERHRRRRWVSKDLEVVNDESR